jgi:GT2 family glycosyltransferase
MKVTVILLDYLRHDFTDRVVEAATQRAGYPFDWIRIDRKGISAAINQGIYEAGDTDAVVTLANDILMPDQWLAQMVHHLERIPETGTCGFHTVENIGGLTNRGGLDVHEWPVAFGNIIIPRSTIEKVGYFNNDFDPYGTQDHDYATRCTMAGLIHYYIQGSRAEHIGHDVGNGTEYRKMKDDSLQLASAKTLYWNQYYNREGFYLPYDQEALLIEKEQYFGEIKI